MNSTQYRELENDKRFKRYYMGKTMWWKSFLLFAPACLIFIGLAGVMHMGYNDNLWSWYAAPYIAAFVLGTAWLKGIKNHIQAKMLEDKERYLVCAARAIGDKNGRYYFLFSKDSKRHNETLINKLAKEIDFESLDNDLLKKSHREMQVITTPETETQMYLHGVPSNRVMRTNKINVGEGITPLLYITKKDLFVIRNKDLK